MKDDKEEVSPDSLMGDFRGRGLVTILIFTVVVHVVIFGSTSLGYLKNEVLGADKKELSQQERVDAAVRDATVAIREIAEKYGITPQEVSDRFAQGGSRTGKAVDAVTKSGEETGTATPAADADPAPEAVEKPKSAIEKQLETVAPPPEVPNLNKKAEDDLF